MLEKLNQLGNYELGKDYLLVSLNPKIYPLQTIKAACRSLSSEATFMLDGNPDEEILVEIRTKDPRAFAVRFADAVLQSKDL